MAFPQIVAKKLEVHKSYIRIYALYILCNSMSLYAEAFQFFFTKTQGPCVQSMVNEHMPGLGWKNLGGFHRTLISSPHNTFSGELEQSLLSQHQWLPSQMLLCLNDQISTATLQNLLFPEKKEV